MAVDRKYLEEAKQMLMGGYENQKVQLNNSFNQNVQGLEGQKAGVNQNFDNQLQQNAMNTTRSQNQYNNNTIARGLGRSTIATSGQAGIQDQGNRIANQVNDQRTQALGNIESQKTMLQQALQENLLGLQSKQESEALSLAQQLEALQYDRDWQNQQSAYQQSQDKWEQDFKAQQFEYQNQQFAYQQSQDKWNQDFKMQQFEYQKQQDALARQLAARSGGGSGSSRSSNSKSSGSNFNATAAWREFDKLLKTDSTKGWYEAGRFAERIAKVDPENGAMMMKAYREMRKKAGSVEKQTATNKNSGKTYTNY